HLVSTEVLDALGPQGFLINVARGSVVDEAALVTALQQQRIAGAGLDVFEDEPRPKPELLALDNVVLAPHIASGTHETRRAMADLVLHNLQQYIATGRPAAEVPWSAAQ
ncbi:MAG: NAD(P)-dependent oxidoreductase, partial [Comamonas sp.]